MWTTAREWGAAAVEPGLLPGLRGLADSCGAPRTRSESPAQVRALRRAVGGPVAVLHLLWRTGARPAGILGAGRSRGDDQGGDLCHLSGVPQVDRQSPGLSCLRAAAAGSGNDRVRPRGVGPGLQPASAERLS